MKTLILHHDNTEKPFKVFSRKTTEGVWLHFWGETSFHPWTASQRAFPENPERHKKSTASGEVRSFLPGKILHIKVQEGDTVKEGDVLLILEAMKMEYEVKAPKEGAIKTLLCEKNSQVSQNTLLLEIE